MSNCLHDIAFDVVFSGNLFITIENEGIVRQSLLIRNIIQLNFEK